MVSTDARAKSGLKRVAYKRQGPKAQHVSTDARAKSGLKPSNDDRINHRVKGLNRCPR